MKIKITGRGIFGLQGEIAVGTELDVQSEPLSWAGRYVVLSDEDTDGKTGITNPEKGEGDTLDREDLKKQADELGIEYARNISTSKLKELIDAALSE